VSATLPTFLVIGALKSGSTSLHQYLDTHPQVFVPKVKELNFFFEPVWDLGVDWYASWFRDAGDARAVGEASPRYTCHPAVPGVPERIAAVLPDARLVYVLRDPIERLVSHHRHVEIEWRAERTLDDVASSPASDLVAASRYAMQIDEYLRHFRREQLLVITTEDLRDRREETLRSVFTFLGVDPSWVPPNLGTEFNRATDLREAPAAAVRLRRTPRYQRLKHRVPPAVRRAAWQVISRRRALPPERSSLSPHARDALVATLRPDLERLRHHLGADFHCWGLLD
jgi:hypothetical protein